MRRPQVRHQYLLTAGAVVTFAVGAAGQTYGGRQEISPTSGWGISGTDCMINSGFEDGTEVLVSTQGADRELQIYDPRFKGIVNGKTVRLAISAGEAASTATTYDATAFRQGKILAYVVTIRDDLLDRAAKSDVLRLYRDGVLIGEYQLAGFGEAFARFRACKPNFSGSFGNDKEGGFSDTADAMNGTDAADAGEAPAESFGEPK